ncbi:hypothetical protein SAMN05444166_0347 [Singulisphaera sp. GP187]|nr:hypothetical protein SAMN05444166_0347 [Singulisphaera sp. GP187]
MTRYFVAANFWLATTLLVLLGQRFERSSPTYYSFFGQAWMTPTTYNVVLLLCGTVSVVFFGMTWTTRSNRAPSRKPDDDPGV